MPESLGLDEGAYLDILPTKEGFNQIALFGSAAATTPQWLTSNATEVVNLLSVDVQRRIVLVVSIASSTPSVTYRHLILDIIWFLVNMELGAAFYLSQFPSVQPSKSLSTQLC